MQARVFPPGMSAIERADKCWLTAVGMFSTSPEATVLARHVLFSRFAIPAGAAGRRVFSVALLTGLTGWPEAVVRRILGQWKEMRMVEVLRAPTVSHVSCRMVYKNSGRSLPKWKPHAKAGGVRLRLRARRLVFSVVDGRAYGTRRIEKDEP